MLRSESLKALAPALVKAQQKMGAALKDSKNPFFKSKYADLNSIIDAAVPALNEEGIAVLQSPGVTAEGTSVINTILLHSSGEFIAGQSKVVAAKANDPQAEGSATTYSRRYGLQSMVTLKAEDDDGEKAMGRDANSSTTTNTQKATSGAKATSNDSTKESAADAKMTAANPENNVNKVPAKTTGRGGWGKSAAKKTETKSSTTTTGDMY